RAYRFRPGIAVPGCAPARTVTSAPTRTAKFFRVRAGPCRLLRGRGPRRMRATSRGRGRVRRERPMTRAAMRLAPGGACQRARQRAGRRPAATSARELALGLPLGPARAARRRTERHSRAPGLRQADRDRLLRRPRAVLALADVVHLLAHE